jgi:phospholipase C
MRKENSKIDGLTGKEYNLMNPFNKHSARVFVSDDAQDVSPDPHHDIPDTLQQQFGGPNMTHLDPPPMSGFVANGESFYKGLGMEVMKAHKVSTVPVLTMLAREFALFNYWFASVPASTEPNRMFLHSGTSWGSAREPGYAEAYNGFPQKTVFETLDDVGKTWKVYYAQTSTILWFQEMRKSQYWNNFWSYNKFFDDVAQGTLQTYIIIDPR